MESLVTTFARRVKVLRKQRGLTQEQLGRASELDYKYVGALERGERTPSFPAIERLAKALKVDYYELFLSENIAANQLEKRIQSSLGGLERAEHAAEVQEFFGDLLSAVQKLDKKLSR